MKKLIALAVALVVIVAGGFYFLNRGKGTDNTDGGLSSDGQTVSDNFTAQVEMQVYSVNIDGTITREGKDKITVQIKSPEEMADFSVEFDNANKDKPVVLKFKNLEYNVGNSATPLTNGVSATAKLLVLMNENGGDGELSITDDTFGKVTLTRKDGELVIKSDDNNLKVRIYDFS